MPFEAYVCVCSATVLARGKGEPGLHTSLSLLDSIIKDGFTNYQCLLCDKFARAQEKVENGLTE